MVTNIESLPNEILQGMLSWAEIKTLGRCAQVCKNWNAVSSSNFMIWGNIIKRFFLPSSLDRNANFKEIMRVMDAATLKSNDALVARVQQLLDRVQSGESCQFRCVIQTSKYPKRHFDEIRFEIESNVFTGIYDVKDQCILSTIGDGSLTQGPVSNQGYIRWTFKMGHGVISYKSEGRVYSCTSDFAKSSFYFPCGEGRTTHLEKKLDLLIEKKVDQLNYVKNNKLAIVTFAALAIIIVVANYYYNSASE